MKTIAAIATAQHLAGLDIRNAKGAHMDVRDMCRAEALDWFGVWDDAYTLEFAGVSVLDESACRAFLRAVQAEYIDLLIAEYGDTDADERHAADCQEAE